MVVSWRFSLFLFVKTHKKWRNAWREMMVWLNFKRRLCKRFSVIYDSIFHLLIYFVTRFCRRAVGAVISPRRASNLLCRQPVSVPTTTTTTTGPTARRFRPTLIQPAHGPSTRSRRTRTIDWPRATGTGRRGVRRRGRMAVAPERGWASRLRCPESCRRHLAADSANSRRSVGWSTSNATFGTVLPSAHYRWCINSRLTSTYYALL